MGYTDSNQRQTKDKTMTPTMTPTKSYEVRLAHPLPPTWGENCLVIRPVGQDAGEVVYHVEIPHTDETWEAVWDDDDDVLDYIEHTRTKAMEEEEEEEEEVTDEDICDVAHKETQR